MIQNNHHMHRSARITRAESQSTVDFVVIDLDPRMAMMTDCKRLKHTLLMIKDIMMLYGCFLMVAINDASLL